MNPEIIVVVEDGVVSTLIANCPVSVAVLDMDTDSADPEDLAEVETVSGEKRHAYVRLSDVDIDPPRTAELFEVVFKKLSQQ